jgi:hypothetical protein
MSIPWPPAWYSFRIEHDDGVHRHFGPIAVLDINQPGFVDRHPVCFSPLDVRRQLAPVVKALVGVFARTDNGVFAPGFVFGPKDRRPDLTNRAGCGHRDGAGGLDECPPRSPACVVCG